MAQALGLFSPSFDPPRPLLPLGRSFSCPTPPSWTRIKLTWRMNSLRKDGHMSVPSRGVLTSLFHSHQARLTVLYPCSALPSTLRSLNHASATTSTSLPPYSASKVSSILDSTLGYS